MKYQQSPIAAVQMLWVNLIMDSLASLALATEPPDDSLLKRPPVRRGLSIVSDQMWVNMLGHAVFQLAVVFIVLLWRVPNAAGEWVGISVPGADNNDDICREVAAHAVSSSELLAEGSTFYKCNHKASEHYTFLFNVFVQLQLFNEINCRKLQGELNVFVGIVRNPWFLGILVLTAVVQYVMVQYGSYAIRVQDGGLSLEQWGWCLAIGAASLIWQQVLNCLRVVFGRTGSARYGVSTSVSGAVASNSPSKLSRSSSNVRS